MKHLVVALALSLAFLSNSAQQTGSFDISVAFSQPDYNFTRTLYYFVPSNYDSTQSYKLVVGFRGGPHTNAGQFRDQLTFLSDSIGAIILCPENSGHFWNQEGLTKKLFEYSLDTTLALYNIDTNFIYLTGLSYGGRHSVIVSMDTDNGPIPHLRGVIPFAAGSDSHLEPDYVDIADFPPACICIGLSDANNFITVSNTLHDDITTNGGSSMLNEISGVGHTVAFPSYPEEMMECIDFIEDQYDTTGTPTSLLNLKVNAPTIFPNPTSGQVTIAAEVPSEVIVRNASGAIVFQKSAGFSNVQRFDIPGQAGFYTIELISGSKSHYFEILKYEGRSF